LIPEFQEIPEKVAVRLRVRGVPVIRWCWQSEEIGRGLLAVGGWAVGGGFWASAFVVPNRIVVVFLTLLADPHHGFLGYGSIKPLRFSAFVLRVSEGMTLEPSAQMPASTIGPKTELSPTELWSHSLPN